MPLIARLIGNKLIAMGFTQRTAFRVEGMPQAIVGEYTDPNDNVVWQITLQRLN